VLILGTIAVVAGSLVWALPAAGVIGVAVGSFLNVVVYRVPRRLSVVRPGSFCPSCRTPIRSLDNVPVVSWLVLRGRCRSCRAPIGIRYPLVEAVTGVVFVAVAWALGPHWAVPGMCVLAAAVLAQAVIELDGLVPPATVSLVGTALGAAALGAAAAADRRWWHLGGALIGTAVSAGVIACVRDRGRRGGYGDGRRPWALLPAGTAIGWCGPVGAPVGVVVTAGALVVLRRSRRPASDAPSDAASDAADAASDAASDEAPGKGRRADVAVAVLAGTAAAVIAAALSGGPIGL
jgi:leader peptidase (prepilin peptidase)/N-methyltransferase